MDFFENLGLRKDGDMFWSCTSPGRRQTHIWTSVSSSNIHTYNCRDSNNQLLRERKLFQINTLYSNTIGSCVPICEKNVNKDHETEWPYKVLTDPDIRNKPLVQYNTHPRHHYSKIWALVSIPTKTIH